jgi:hypothetical protein
MIFGLFKGVLGGIGKLAGFAAPFAQFVPGMGTLASVGLGVGGGLLSKLSERNVKFEEPKVNIAALERQKLDQKRVIETEQNSKPKTVIA